MWLVIFLCISNKKVADPNNLSSADFIKFMSNLQDSSELFKDVSKTLGPSTRYANVAIDRGMMILV